MTPIDPVVGARPDAEPPDPPVAHPRFQIDKRFYPPLLVTAILLSGHLTMGILESPGQTLLAIGAAVAAELALGRMARGFWPHMASAYITGISVGALVRTPDYWPFALCSVISIMSKYVIRFNDRHLWNPSNFGVSFMLFVYPMDFAHLSIQWGNAWWSVIAVWAFGFFVISRLNRFHICLTYALSFLVLAFCRQFITGHPFLAEVAPITGPMYQLFILFMITDPATTLRTKRGQVWTAFAIACVEHVLRCLPALHPQSQLALGLGLHAPFYALFLVGPVFKLFEVREDMHQSPRPAA